MSQWRVSGRKKSHGTGKRWSRRCSKSARHAATTSRRPPLELQPSLLGRLLGASSTVVRDVRFDEDDHLILEVKPTYRKPRCGVCGKGAKGYDSPSEPRRWRDLAFGECVLWLEYHLRRVDCPTCGVRVERIPWAAHGSRFTLRLEELVAFLAQMTDKTAAAAIAGVSWRAVGTVVRRVVDQHLDDSRFDGVTRIAIDEFSWSSSRSWASGGRAKYRTNLSTWASSAPCRVRAAWTLNPLHDGDGLVGAGLAWVDQAQGGLASAVAEPECTSPPPVDECHGGRRALPKASAVKSESPRAEAAQHTCQPVLAITGKRCFCDHPEARSWQGSRLQGVLQALREGSGRGAPRRPVPSSYPLFPVRFSWPLGQGAVDGVGLGGHLQPGGGALAAGADGNVVVAPYRGDTPHPERA